MQTNYKYAKKFKAFFLPSPSDRVSRWREVYLSLSCYVQYVASPKIASLGFQMERKQTSTLVTINGDVSSIRRAKREYRTGFSR